MSRTSTTQSASQSESASGHSSPSVLSRVSLSAEVPYSHRSHVSTGSTGTLRGFKSRLITEPVYKPWLERKQGRSRNWHAIMPSIGFVVGVAICGFLIYNGYSTINKHKYCLVFEDEFSGNELNAEKWSHDVEIGGYGNGQFEWTTTDNANSVVKDGRLSLRPTMTDQYLTEAQILNGYTLNLTADGSCTSADPFACARSSNTTEKTIINPVRSSRVHTKGKFSIKYGRVEVRARMPVGDWLWPAIWMMPVEDTYGPWPASGEIDIAESRGNGIEYGPGGSDQISSAIHWGPEPDMDRYYQTTNNLKVQRTDFAKSYHTYGLEWTEDYMFMYIDNKLLQVTYIPFDQYFWKKGHFPPKNINNTVVTDIWSQTGHKSAPFDQSFYLILNLAVGGTNGWFPDISGEKPWVNEAPTAMQDFYKARQTWQSTWTEQSSLDVESVRMWQQCD